jgi:hypothetical protein
LVACKTIAMINMPDSNPIRRTLQLRQRLFAEIAFLSTAFVSRSASAAAAEDCRMELSVERHPADRINKADN